MIGYDDLRTYAPANLPKAEHDAWFEERGYDIDALIKVGHELATQRMSGLHNRAKLTADDLALALISAFLFGVELIIRCEREEPS